MNIGIFPMPVSIRIDMRLFVIAAFFTAGLFWTAPARAQIGDPQVNALVEALRLSAPNTGNPNDGLYSDWKIRWENIVRWSKRCTGREMEPAEFEANPIAARDVLACIMGKILREQYALCNDESIAVRRAASWWMTGDPEQYHTPKTGPYTQKVLDFYREVLR